MVCCEAADRRGAANWTGIPVFKLTEEETPRLLRMEEELHKRIIGQEDAVKVVSQAIRRTRAGLKDPKRPSGSFIFAGPSGVGKTELSKPTLGLGGRAVVELAHVDLDERVVLAEQEVRQQNQPEPGGGSDAATCATRSCRVGLR